MKKDQPLHLGVGLFAKKLFWSCDIVDIHETKKIAPEFKCISIPTRP